jgi:hypothetical protein
MGRINIWEVYRGVASELNRSLCQAKQDGRKVTSRFIDKEIKEIIKDEAEYWAQDGHSTPRNITTRKAKRHIMLILEDDTYGQPANDYA